MNSEIADVLPAQPHERWFDLCFRLIIVVLAGFWLLAPPVAGEPRPGEIKAAIATK